MKRAVRTFGLSLALLGLACSPSCRQSRTRRPEASVENKPSTLEERLDRADALRRERDYQRAGAVYGSVLDDLSPSSGDALRWRALFGWARTRLTLGSHDDAKSRLEELRVLAAGEPAREARTAYLAAAVLHREGDLDSAEEEAKLSLKWARRSKDWKLVLDARGILATVYSLSGRHSEALGIHEAQVAQLRETAPGSGMLALELNELGIDYRHIGRFDEALSVFEESLALYRRIEDIEGEGMVLYNLGSVYAEMGDVGRALELKLDSLERDEIVGHSYGLGLVNEDIGEAYLKAGNLGLARNYLEKALYINRSAHQAHGEIGSLQSLGRLELEAGRLDRAREDLQQARTLAERHGYGQQALTARIALSELAARSGEFQEALRLANGALEEVRASRGDPEVEFDALRARARALDEMHRIEEAVATHLEAIALLESWRGRLALGDLRLGVARPRWDVFESAIRDLFAVGKIEQAFEISEHAKSRLLLELMGDRSAASPAETPEQRLRAELRERFAAWQSAGAERKDAIEAKIRELADRLVDLESSAMQHAPSRAAARHPAPLSVSEVVDRLAAPGVGLLVYFWGERDVYGWWIGPDGVRGHRLGSSEDLRALVEFLRLTIEAPDAPADWRSVAARAYRRLVAPLYDGRAREIRIVADGPLTVIPFEVMTPAAGAAPLGLAHVISYGPSASVLAALTRRKRLAPEGEALLALAYSPPEASHVQPGGAATRQADSLRPIPQAEAEARFITHLFRDQGARLLTGGDASFADWKKAAPERHHLLHFATHARTNDLGSKESYLLLSDGRLTTSRIRDLHLTADLVTLSACETALGYRVRGEGVVGLTHAFLAAGAAATLVSLWRVDDRSTARFMEDFYTKLRSGRRPTEALLETRRAFADAGDGALHRPTVWANFVLVGKP